MLQEKGVFRIKDDLEALKIIREKESSVESDINSFIEEQKKMLAELKKESEEKIEEAREKAENSYIKHVSEVRKETEKQAKEIIEEAKVRAQSISLKVPDKDLEKLVTDLMEKIVKGD